MKTEANLTITAKEQAEIDEVVSPVVQRAAAIVVKTPGEYTAAATFLAQIKAAQKTLQAKRDLIEKPLKSALKALKEFFATPEAQLEQAEGLVKRSLIAYDDEQEALRKAEQRKLDEVARKERERLHAAAVEAQRKAEEKAATERHAALEALRQGNEARAQKLEEKAAATEAKGLDKAQTLQQTAASVVPPMVSRAPPKVEGLAKRELWSAAVDDFPALVKAVAEGQVPYAALVPSMPFLNGQAKALKTELDYPGVRAVRSTSLASGSR